MCAPCPVGGRPEAIILAADDDRDRRQLYRACFDTSGYHTSEAGTGSPAIVAAVELIPDVLRMTYVLPDIDGVTVARRRTTGSRMAHSKDRPPIPDDITDPREILLVELAVARHELRELVAKMKRERVEWEARLEELQRSQRLTAAQKKRLRPRPKE